MYIESHPRQLVFLRKSDCLGCAVLLCLVGLFDLACFFLPSASLVNIYTLARAIPHKQPYTHPSLHTPIPTHTHPYTHPSLHTPIHTHTHPYTHPSIHTPIPTHTHPYTHPSLHTPIHTHTHPYTHPSLHTPIPTHTHPYTHSYMSHIHNQQTGDILHIHRPHHQQMGDANTTLCIPVATYMYVYPSGTHEP